MSPSTPLPQSSPQSSPSNSSIAPTISKYRALNTTLLEECRQKDSEISSLKLRISRLESALNSSVPTRRERIDEEDKVTSGVKVSGIKNSLRMAAKKFTGNGSIGLTEKEVDDCTEHEVKGKETGEILTFYYSYERVVCVFKKGSRRFVSNSLLSFFSLHHCSKIFQVPPPNLHLPPSLGSSTLPLLQIALSSIEPTPSTSNIQYEDKFNVVKGERAVKDLDWGGGENIYIYIIII